jgi:predicted O-methyltransferase YrrM
MDKDGLVFAHITEYMRSIRRERQGKLGELERKARAEKFPVSEPETADLLDILCRLKNPKRILELGTCIGFSSLLMREACPHAEIITIERNPAMITPAKENLKEFNATNINMLEGNAVKLLPTLTEPFDFIFIDAAKGQYPVFLKECLRLLNPGGIIIADNVLFNGYVAKGIPDIRRNKTIITRLDEFLKMLQSNEELNTVILPISDGVTVSFKKN